jgi:hypothetical protein
MRSLMFLTVALTAACGSSSRTTTPAPAPESTSYTSSPTQPEQQVEPGPDLAARDCPVDTEHAIISAEPTDAGIALVFVTDIDHVADVRARVRAFVETPAGEPAPTSDPLSGELRSGSFGSIPVTMAVTDAIDGVRLELRPVDPSQLGELRSQVRGKVVAMESGACGPTEVGILSPPLGKQRAELGQRGRQP